MKAWLASLALAAVALAAPGEAWAQSKKFVNKGHSQEQAPPPRRIVQNYQPAPAIWLLHDEDTRIYLFGTIHALPRGFRWRSERFDAILDEVDELVVESSDADAEVSLAALLTPLIETASTRPRVSDRLSPESAGKWLSLGEISGMPGEAFDHLPPFLTLFVLAQVDMSNNGSDHEFGVESVLEAEFKAANKPVGSIEDAADVMRALLALDESVLIDELERELAEWDGQSFDGLMNFETDQGAVKAGIKDDGLAMEHRWARGQLATEPMFDASAIGRMLHQVLLVDRNRAWAGWLQDRLDRPGKILLAVGAGHLEGEDSIFEYLAERGLVPERLN